MRSNASIVLFLYFQLLLENTRNKQKRSREWSMLNKDETRSVISRRRRRTPLKSVARFHSFMLIIGLSLSPSLFLCCLFSLSIWLTDTLSLTLSLSFSFLFSLYLSFTYSFTISLPYLLNYYLCALHTLSLSVYISLSSLLQTVSVYLFPLLSPSVSFIFFSTFLQSLSPMINLWPIL